MSLSEYLMNNLLLVGVALASGAMLLWPHEEQTHTNTTETNTTLGKHLLPPPF